MADAGRKIIAVRYLFLRVAKVKHCVIHRPRVSLLSSAVLEPTFYVVSQALVSCRSTTSKFLLLSISSCRSDDVFQNPRAHVCLLSFLLFISSILRAGLDRTRAGATLHRCLLGSGHCLSRQQSSLSFAMHACFRLFNRFCILVIPLLIDFKPRRSRFDQCDLSGRVEQYMNYH